MDNVTTISKIKQQGPEWVNRLSEEEALELLYDWSCWARPEQMTPVDDWWNIWIYLAGRGAGKTRTDAEDMKLFGMNNPKSRLAIVAPTYMDARDTCVEGESGLLSVLPPDQIKAWNRSLGELLLKNGTRYKLFSADEPERLRGPQHHRVWCEELCAWGPNMQDTWDNMVFGNRLGKKPRIVISTTPKPLKFLRQLLKRDDIYITRGSTFDNTANLAPSVLAEFKNRYLGTRTGRQELYAEVLDDVEGALWTRDMIEASKVREVPDMLRVVVGIDPAVSSGEDSDMTGIVVAGLGVDGLGYVLYSEGVRMSPDGWAKRAVYFYHAYQADAILAEINQGGDLVTNVIKTVDRRVPVKVVRATRGKILRAEPVAALWEQQRVKIMVAQTEGREEIRVDHSLLEDQMCSYTGIPGEESPDLLDAAVYDLKELMIPDLPSASEQVHDMQHRLRLAQMRSAQIILPGKQPQQEEEPILPQVQIEPIQRKQEKWWQKK